ncbi:hypothetical protein HXX76_012524 [Chlamydomonas incerta]|uniref:Uncharacterized protein n=1 Tax=Chlamydomonas incerta TaxID=51695 RepID=A0A835SHY5_CHLIN|nr:hypothetical protein HXX76_012524 [Chlamydomonas incerta]|eukprot:KAG2427329.1 hypothetical protein HXX76_012524 [Chlamydomonas incerta]
MDADTSGEPAHTTDEWARLSRDLIRKVASRLHPNDVAGSLVFVNRETAACLRGSGYNKLALAQQLAQGSDGVARAVQPWPDHAFVVHWGRPEPWRALPYPQRLRLLSLAASSGHLLSLEAALTHAGCAADSEAITAAAAAGHAAACERLLREAPCPANLDKPSAAAARSGHFDVMQVLLDAATDSSRHQQCMAGFARGACIGGQAGVLEWLAAEHSLPHGSLTPWDVGLVARFGHVAMLERLMSQLPDYAPAGAAAGGPMLDEAAQRARREARGLMLNSITFGCPLEAMQRHYDRLWGWRPVPPAAPPDAVAVAPGGGGGGAAAAAAAQPAAEGGAEGEGEGEAGAGAGQEGEQQAAEAGADIAEPGQEEALDGTLCGLLASAAASRTPCWAAKLDFLRSRWGPAVVGEVLAGERGPAYLLHSAARQPDFLQRLTYLHAAGMPRHVDVYEAGVYAAVQGHADALVYMWDERGERLDEEFVRRYVAWVHTPRPGDMAILELLRGRGARFQLRHVALAADRRWPDASLMWLMEAAEHGDLPPAEVRSCWSKAFSAAAAAGAGIGVLQALRARGAAVDLEAVAMGGSAEALEWARGQEQEEQRALVHGLQALYTLEESE